MNKVYMCIDLKSFYASVECVERGLDPLKTNLVVADEERTDKTVCLAITPPLKAYGLGGRARLYEVKQKVKEINYQRYQKNGYKKFLKSSYNDDELQKYLNLKLDFIIAKPSMNKYMEYSCNIYKTYLKYLSKDDVFVYSIDEIFCDLTPYISFYKTSPKEIVSKIIKDVYENYGITATAGIGTNLYLAKIAMDIVAKHKEPNTYGVRIAELDEQSYRKKLWDYKPLTAFWRLGPATARKLAEYNIYTMGDICKCSLNNERLLYKMFGVNAEILIDHAWGYENTSLKDIKNYKPKNNSISVGQVLHTPYNYEDAKVIVKEMSESLSNRLIINNLVTKKIGLTIFYDVSNLINNLYSGEISIDHYGRKVPRPSHSTINLDFRTSSYKIIKEFTLELYDKIVNPNLLIRKIDIAAIDVTSFKEEDIIMAGRQLNLLDSFKGDYSSTKIKNEKKLQETIIEIKNKYGKNIILKGTNLLNTSTMKERNMEVGGHRG